MGLAALAALVVASALVPPRDPRNGRRVFVLAIDGLAPALLERFSTGTESLPHWQGLLAKGSRASLRLPQPASSAAVFTSLIAGQLPRDTGIRAATIGRALAAASDVRVPRLWRWLDSAGRSSAFVGWPATWPSTGTAALLVSDRFVQALGGRDPSIALPTRSVVPGDRLPDLAAAFPSPQEIVRDGLPRGWVPSTAALSPWARDLGAFRIAAAEWRRGNRDLVAVRLDGLDQVQHLYWLFQDEVYRKRLEDDPRRWAEDAAAVAGSQDPAWPPRQLPLADGPVDATRLDQAARAVPDYYAFLDRLVGEIAGGLGPTDVLMVVADQGFRDATFRAVPLGSHGDNGFWLCFGASVRPGGRVAGATLFDVVPTAMALLGMPVEDTWRGAPRSEFFVAGLEDTGTAAYRLDFEPPDRGGDPDESEPGRLRLLHQGGE